MNDNGPWAALGLGACCSLLAGCGLLALMLFSSRSGHDDAADPFRKKQEPPAVQKPVEHDLAPAAGFGQAGAP